MAQEPSNDLERQLLADLGTRASTQLPEIATRFYAGVCTDGAAGKLQLAFVEWLAASLGGDLAAIVQKRACLSSVEREVALPRDFRLVSINVLRRDLDDRIAALYAPLEAREIARAVDKLLDLEIAALVRGHQLEADENLARYERATLVDRVVAIQTLSTGFAHELRNPLNAARLQLAVLERRLPHGMVDRRVDEAVAAIDHELERLSRLLVEFLAFARPAELSLCDGELGEVVEIVLGNERAFAEARRVHLAGAPIERAIGRVDPAKLTQVVQNLVHNAIEACAPGGHVVVSLHADGERAHLSVEDDGPGIPEAIRRRIYEPFFTTKDSGTGLGLSIAHSVIQQHGGTIELRTSQRGTRFEVVLPGRAA